MHDKQKVVVWWKYAVKQDYKLYDPTVRVHRCCDHLKIDSITTTLGFAFHIVWAEMYPKAIQPTIGTGSSLILPLSTDSFNRCHNRLCVSQCHTAHNMRWMLSVTMTVGWNRLSMEVLTLLFVRNFESKYWDFFLCLPCKIFVSCGNLNMQTLKYTYWFYYQRHPQNSTDHETVKNTCNGLVYTSFPVEANDSTPYKLHISKRSR